MVTCDLPVLVPGDGETAMPVTLPLSLEASNPTGREWLLSNNRQVTITAEMYVLLRLLF